MVPNVPLVHFRFLKKLKGNLKLIRDVLFLKMFLLTFSIQVAQSVVVWMFYSPSAMLSGRDVSR